MDIYLPPNIKLEAGSQLLSQLGEDQDWGAAGTAGGTAGSTAATQAAAAEAMQAAGAAVDADSGGSAAVVGTTGGVPMVLFCHGGVWASGSKWHYGEHSVCSACTKHAPSMRGKHSVC